MAILFYLFLAGVFALNVYKFINHQRSGRSIKRRLTTSVKSLYEEFADERSLEYVHIAEGVDVFRTKRLPQVTSRGKELAKNVEIHLKEVEVKINDELPPIRKIEIDVYVSGHRVSNYKFDEEKFNESSLDSILYLALTA